MAEATNQATNDTGLSQDADTSIDDDAFDDIDVSDVEDDGSTYGEDSSEESTDDTAATESEDEPDEDSDTDAEDTETETESENSNQDAEPKEESTPPTEAEDREAAAKRAFEAREQARVEAQQREQAKAEAANKLLDESYTKTYDQAVEAGFDDQQARLQAAQALATQQLQIDSYNNRVMQVTNTLQSSLNATVGQIDLFQSKDPVVQEAMLQAVDDFEAMYVKKDANGDPIQVTGDVQQFLQARADVIRKLTGTGAKQQEQAKNTQKKRTLTTPSRTPRQPKVDPDLAAFDEEASRW